MINWLPGSANSSCWIIFRPGFARINLPYFMDDITVHFVLEAVDMVATHGWKLLPQVKIKNQF